MPEEQAADAERTDAEPFVPSRGGLRELSDAAQFCRGCGLYRNATQAVFGSGRARARVMLIGEQPGDREDREGQPFVGPAGRILDRAFVDIGLAREEVYLTNAVKHFKFVPPERGKRRIHKKPSASEVNACWPWLTAELRLVRPVQVVCLGATAARAVLGNGFRLTQQRGIPLDPPASLEAGSPGYPSQVLATTHPSAVVRSPDRHAAYDQFVADLRVLVQG